VATKSGTGTPGAGGADAAGSPAATAQSTAAGTSGTAGADAAAPAAATGTPATATASYGASAAAAAAHTPVDLQHAVDAVRASFTMAARQGQTQALITLSPPALGAIRISLSQTSDGLVARVTADHPDALQLLQQNSSELRNSLQSSGLQLLRLDIGAGGQGGEHPDASGKAGSQRSGSDSDADQQAEEDPQPSSTPSLSLSSSAGSHVDVLV
jgi:flagellar hook-length control protein FliK